MGICAVRSEMTELSQTIERLCYVDCTIKHIPFCCDRLKYFSKYMQVTD